MAEFCKDCSIDNFGQDFEDLAGLCQPGQYAIVLCEGCGSIMVDNEGICQGDCLDPEHGSKVS